MQSSGGMIEGTSLAGSEDDHPVEYTLICCGFDCLRKTIDDLTDYCTQRASRTCARLMDISSLRALDSSGVEGYKGRLA